VDKDIHDDSRPFSPLNPGGTFVMRVLPSLGRIKKLWLNFGEILDMVGRQPTD